MFVIRGGKISPMSYKILEHTADVRLSVQGKSLGGLFSDAVLGMAQILLQEKPGGRQNAKIKIKIESPDVTALLIDFLNEVLTLSHEQKAIFYEVKFSKINEAILEAEIFGKKIDAFNEDIKAVTYHEADVKKNEKGKWETKLIFDI